VITSHCEWTLGKAHNFLFTDCKKPQYVWVCFLAYEELNQWDYGNDGQKKLQVFLQSWDWFLHIQLSWNNQSQSLATLLYEQPKYDIHFLMFFSSLSSFSCSIFGCSSNSTTRFYI
jgi:hypothetical protein